MRDTVQRLIEKLTADGLSFSNSKVIVHGDYSVREAEWNYKDVAHISFMHKAQTNAIHYNISNAGVSSIWVLRLFGTKIPVNLVMYQTDPNTLVAMTSLPFILLLTETKWEAVTSSTCKITTSYNVGSLPLLRLIHWVFHRMLAKSNAALMVDDIPMRQRRFLVKKWGYGFASEGAHYEFSDLAKVTSDNVIPPVIVSPRNSIGAIENVHQLREDERIFLGESDRNGVQVLRKNEKISIYPRLCPHEGASLDHGSCSAKQVSCPWHGRAFSAFTHFDIHSPSALEHSAIWLGAKITLKYANGRLEVLSEQLPTSERSGLKDVAASSLFECEDFLKTHPKSAVGNDQQGIQANR